MNWMPTRQKQRNSFGTRIKIMWEEQLVDSPIDSITSVNIPLSSILNLPVKIQCSQRLCMNLNKVQANCINLRMRRSFVKLPGLVKGKGSLVKSVTKMVTGCLRMTKVAIFIL